MTAITRREAIAALTAPGQPYELIDATIAGRRRRVFRQAPASLRDMVEAAISDQPFLVFNDERWTFREAWQQAARIAQVLRTQAGIGQGERVAIAMRNYPEWMLAFTAITSIGAIAVAVNGHWQADELARGLHESGARAVVADEERVARIVARPGGHDCRVLAVRTADLPPGVQSLSELTGALGDVQMPDAGIDPDDLAIMMFTSGSTGHPKGVPSTHRQVVTALMSWELDRLIAERVGGIASAPASAQPGTLLVAPLFHVTALHASYLASYRQQRRVVCMARWDAQSGAALIAAHRLTSVAGPPAITGDLVRVAEAGGHDLSSLLLVGGGGAPRAPEQVRRIATAFGTAMPNTGWGMTETNAIGTSIGGEDYLQRPGSSGRCSLVLQLKVVDGTGVQVPTGERGELLVRGTSLFAGYWNDEAATRAAFDDDWFRTGDVAYFDAEGFLFIVDRIKELIIRGGENIGCGHVEAALLLHPQVLEAAVFAVPDERLGEEVGAMIHADRAIDPAALREFLARHLARFEVPRYLVQSAQPLPRTPSGKIFRRAIRDQACAIIAGGGGAA